MLRFFFFFQKSFSNRIQTILSAIDFTVVLKTLILVDSVQLYKLHSAFPNFVILNRIFCGILQVPWEDLRYLFGEIMYGGHITDDWDRRLCRTYLEEYMNPDMLEGELYLAPGFPIPPNTDYKVRDSVQNIPDTQ